MHNHVIMCGTICYTKSKMKYLKVNLLYVYNAV